MDDEFGMYSNMDNRSALLCGGYAEKELICWHFFHGHPDIQI